MESLFRKEIPRPVAPTPYELIEPEIVHLQKGYSIRHGEKHKRTPPWLTLIILIGLVWLYLMDPILHAWYRGEAVRTYLYLHNYGSSSLAAELAATRIFNPDEVETLNRRQGAFQDYYSSPQAAENEARSIISYMHSVRALHQGKYQHLDPIGRTRYLLFIWPGLVLPTDWPALDPSIGD